MQSSVLGSTCSCKAKQRMKGKREEKESFVEVFKKIRLGKANPNSFCILGLLV